LTVDDLSNRADRAYADHLDGYTAGAALHRLYLAEALDDETLREALDLVLSRLRERHATTRAVWRRAYRAWAAAAGVVPLPDDAGDPAAADDPSGRDPDGDAETDA
jgi:hypothetical protein